MGDFSVFGPHPKKKSTNKKNTKSKKRNLTRKITRTFKK